MRHLLGHTSGLSGWQEPVDVETLYGLGKEHGALLASQAPWWEPGHSFRLPRGYILVREVIRRVTGQTVGEFFASEVANPLGADFHIGLDSSHFRAGRQRHSAAAPTSGQCSTRTALRCERWVIRRSMASWAWTVAWRGAEIPAANGHGNASSVAVAQSVLACGGEVRGKRFLSPEGSPNRVRGAGSWYLTLC